MSAEYKILSVSDDGYMTVLWGNGLKITYSVPEDINGNVLILFAMEDWLADIYIQDIEPRERNPARLNSLKGLIRGPQDPFVDISDLVDV